MREHIRTVRLDGHTVTLFATNGRDWRGQTCLAYTLIAPDGSTVFDGSDFYGSPLHSDDSDDTIRSLLSFLTLRPGDIEREYFAGYTPEQIAWRDQFAESLSMWALDDSPIPTDND